MASERIKGITIEIGGDTTKLVQALKDVDTQLKETQNALKDIDKLLKFDPKNTELLRQKQKALKDAISQTKNRLEELKTAQKGVKEGTAEWDAIQREIIETEQKLESLEKEYRTFGSVAKQQLLAVSTSLKESGQKIGNVGRAITSAGRELTTKVTLPIVAVGTAAVKSAADYERSMAKVKSVTTGVTEEGFQALQETIEKLASTTEFTAGEVADAAYYMGMAGWNATEMIQGLPGVLNLAVASGSDLATTSDIVTDSLTAFGLKAEDTGHFVNVLAEASRQSNTNVELMGESFKYVAPLAGRMGYSIDDVAVALGVVANNGIKGSMAGTSLRNILQRLADPTEKVENSMKELGISLLNDQDEAYTFAELLGVMRESIGDLNINTLEYNRSVDALTSEYEKGKLTEEEYEEGLQKAADALANATEQTEGQANAEKIRQAAILAGARGMPALLALVGASEEEYSKLSDSIYNVGEAAEEMAAIQRDTLTGQLNVLKGQVSMLGAEFGQILLPVIRDGITWLQGLIETLKNMDEGTKERIIKIAEIVAVAGPLVMIIGSIVTSIGFLVTALGFIISPVGLVITALAALAAGIVYLWNTNEKFREGVKKVWEDIVFAVKSAIFAVKDFIEDLKKTISTRFEQIKQTATNVWNSIKEAIKNPVVAIADLVLGRFNAMVGGIKSKMEMARNIVQTVIDTISRIFNTARWELPRIKLPHFKVSKGATVLGVSLPKISVEWYKKAYENPYLFTQPTVVNGRGFGDGGGSGEIVYGRDQLMRDIALAAGETTINVYATPGMDVNQLADKVSQRMAQLQRQRASVYA